MFVGIFSDNSNDAVTMEVKTCFYGQTKKEVLDKMLAYEKETWLAAGGDEGEPLENHLQEMKANLENYNEHYDSGDEEAWSDYDYKCEIKEAK